MDLGLKNKVVLITGGSRGIGKACCISFAEEGARVMFTYNKNKEEADKTLKILLSITPHAGFIQTDTRDYPACREAVQKTIEKLGGIDIVINNAGITKDKALVMMSTEDWLDVINTNLNGMFNASRSVITTFLKQKHGCIINISSVSGLKGIPRQANYCASKAGIIGFTRALACEVAGYNIRVNAICPGYIDTDMVSSLKDDVKNELLKHIPSKRIGSPREVADFCLFLASEKSAYVNGAALIIDGGLTA